MRTIAHISDLHFGRTDARIVEALLADISASPPSVMVVSGDLTQRARPWQYREARHFLDRLPKPLIVVPGNHDIPLYDVIRRFFFTHQRYVDHIISDLAPVYRDDELFVIGLNTARPFSWRLHGFWKDGQIGVEELERLRQQSEKLPPGLVRVVVTHHPFIPPSPEFRGDVVHGARWALPILKASGVDLLLAGHLHVGYCGDVNAHHEAADCSILSVQAGTAVSTRRREARNTYNRLLVEPDHVTVEVRAFDGERFTRDRTTEFRRADGVWRRIE